jgi:effector-binding domain-containing protein
MNNEIKEASFKAKKYLAWKKEIATSEITNKAMYEEGYRKIFGYINTHKIKVTGPGAVLYFKWDELKGRASIAIAAPVESNDDITDNELSLVDVKESKASFAELRGDYSGLKNLHDTLMTYSVENNFKPTLTIEEYTVDPSMDTNPANWITKIYYLHN